ncbi:MAG TPA: helicase-associated domain-containing protein [Trueperaceae bacterium]|nr:helicase-associated domain-containing protein [Trueperaceae bacterium]
MPRSDEQMWLFRMSELDDEEREEETAAWLAATRLDHEPSPPWEADERAARLDARLERMQVAQLKPVLARFVTGYKATRRADMIAQIGEVLRSPSQLDAVVGRLAPLERALLEELKRRGGVADGHELVTFAVLRGHSPPTSAGGMAYGLPLARSAAAAYLAKPILDGLLLPSTVSSAWFEYGSAGAADDLVRADPRLLARVPDGEPEPPVRLELEPVAGVSLQQRHPAAVVLEALDALQLVAGEGGLPVTRRGTIAKPFLTRSLRKRPHLRERLPTVLLTLVALGLVRRPVDAEGVSRPWPVDANGVAELRRLPLALQYAAIVDAGCAARDAVVDGRWARTPLAGRPEVFWRGALDALAALPDHPVTLDGAAAALWDHVLGRVFGPPPYGPAARRYFGPGDARMVAWYGTDRVLEALREVLAGPFADAGLLARGEAARSDGPAMLVAPAAGARWYAGARALLPGHEPASPRGAAGGAIPPTSAGTSAGLEPADLGAGDDAGTHPALLVQPNFEVLVYLDRLRGASLAALECAELSRIDAHTATFRLGRESLNRALERGAGVDEVLGRLAEHALAVPANVADTLRDWAAQRERLRVSVDVRVLEYATRSERDAALAGTVGARPVGERFAILAPDAPAPEAAREHRYLGAPERTLAFTPDGRVRAHGNLDVAARAALKRVARRDPAGMHQLDADAIRAGALTPVMREILQARARGGLPAPLEAVVRAWSGEAASPAVAAATLFRHPEATAWAQHPSLAPHLGAQLSPSTYLVQGGAEAALAAELEALGVTVASSLDKSANELAPTGEGALRSDLSTRKKRELIEAAILARDTIELRYARERQRLGRYGHTLRSRGAVRTERVRPQEVFYQGSLPYLVATTLGGGKERIIRIGYIEALAVRAGD